ncbi:MAG: hypothetical protein QUS09_07330 [Methanotrichaceae archaeon]|nr:hypothetical protein [Methanotrichaceae archaeon]
MVDFKTRLEEAKTLADIFEVVKAVVLKSMKKSRGGLMLGMADLGNHPKGFLGGFFTVGSNVIVLNKNPLQRITETRPELYKPYAFHVLLHEYIHSLGYLDERMVNSKVYEITKEALGEEHLATQIAASTESFMKHLVYPDTAWKADDDRMELEKDFDRSSVSYIA